MEVPILKGAEERWKKLLIARRAFELSDIANSPEFFELTFEPEKVSVSPVANLYKITFGKIEYPTLKKNGRNIFLCSVEDAKLEYDFERVGGISSAIGAVSPENARLFLGYLENQKRLYQEILNQIRNKGTHILGDPEFNKIFYINTFQNPMEYRKNQFGILYFLDFVLNSNHFLNSQYEKEDYSKIKEVNKLLRKKVEEKVKETFY